MKLIIKGLVTLFLVMFLVSCGGSSSVDPGPDPDPDPPDPTPVDENPLVLAFPEDLAVTSPFAEATASASVNANKAVEYLFVKDASDAFTPKPYEERKEEIRNMLVGTTESDCKFSLSLFQSSPEVLCYGPQVIFNNDPDANPQSATLPYGDVGMWTTDEIVEGDGSILTSTGESCAAAKLNSSVSYVSAKVDTATDMFAGMFCMANIDGDNELPEIGVTKNLKSSLERIAADIGGLTISEATISRLADTADGYAVYLSHISANVLMENGKSAVVDINLKHIPADSENTAYKGKLWTTFKSEGGYMSAQGAKQFASSVLYSKDSSGNLSYHIRGGDYNSTEMNPFDSKYNVDPSKKYTGGDTEGWNASFQMGTFSIGADGTTNISYSWQAGPADRATRTFIAQSTATSGCGYYGFGPDISAAGAGNITGFYCKWWEMALKSDEERVPFFKEYAQKQCMTFDAATGKFVYDNTSGLQFLYPPSPYCGESASDFTNFTYYADYSGDIPAGVYSNDKKNPGGNDVTLINLSEVPAAPTAPNDIE